MENRVGQNLFQRVIWMIEIPFHLNFDVSLFDDICLNIIQCVPDLFPDRTVKGLLDKVIGTFSLRRIEFHQIDLRPGYQPIGTVREHRHFNIADVDSRIRLVHRFPREQQIFQRTRIHTVSQRILLSRRKSSRYPRRMSLTEALRLMRSS